MDQVPGGFTVQDSKGLQEGRGGNFEDFLSNTPGIVLQSNSSGEVSRVSIRGSGIQADDESRGVGFLLDGTPYNEADGEALIG